MAAVAQRAQLGPYFKGGALQGGAKLWHFEAGTNTKRDIWNDRNKVIPLPQPLQADQHGIFNFFADGLYKIVVCEPNSSSVSPTNVLYTLDNFAWLDPADTDITEGEPLPSASTMPVGPNVWNHVLGSVDIGVLSGTIPQWTAVFDGSPTLLHSAALLLPGSRDRKMQPNDVAVFLNEGSGIWRMAAHFESEGNYAGRMGTAVSGSSTLAIPTDGDFIEITGNDATIDTIATAAAGYRFSVLFSGSGNQLVHQATKIVCPHGRDFRPITNEVVEFRSMGNGKWVVSSYSGPHEVPGNYVDMHDTAADDGFLLPIGQVVTCSAYRALARKLIPNASVLGLSGTSLATATFDNTTDVWTSAAHGLVNGDIVHLTNSGGALPAGYAVNTVYYVVGATTNTFQLSATYGGAAVNGTTNGTGTHTVHDQMTLPDARGVARVPLDNLGGSSANRVTSASTNGANASVLGGKFGAQTHALTASENGPHGHGISTPPGGSGLPGSRIVLASNDLSGGPVYFQDTDSSGSGSPHSNTQPSMAVGCQIRW